MPYGVYTAGTAGDEVSSTGEGRHLTFTESQLTHPSHTDGFVDKGDPVVIGNMVGVSFRSASVATELVAIDTEGIWQLSVIATNEDGNIAVAVGDEIFINTTTCLLSKNKDKGTMQRFGYALYAITSGETDVIPVKVHFDPDDAIELVGDSAAFYAMGTVNNAREYRYRSTATSGDIRGMYMCLGLNGIGSSGEAVRARTIVEAVGLAGGVHGLHGGVEHDANGTLTGLGVGVRGTYMGPNRACGGTICGGMSELWAEGASTDFSAAMTSIHRFVCGGNATGCATAYNAFEFADIPTGTDATDMLKTDMHTATPTDGLRIVINGAVYHICLVSA